MTPVDLQSALKYSVWAKIIVGGKIENNLIGHVTLGESLGFPQIDFQDSAVQKMWTVCSPTSPRYLTLSLRLLIVGGLKLPLVQKHRKLRVRWS